MLKKIKKIWCGDNDDEFLFWTMVVLAALSLVLWIFSVWLNEEMKENMEKYRLLQVCIVENKELPNPETYCRAKTHIENTEE